MASDGWYCCCPLLNLLARSLACLIASLFKLIMSALLLSCHPLAVYRWAWVKALPHQQPPACSPGRCLPPHSFLRCSLVVLLCCVQVGLGEGFAPSAATSVLAWQVPSTERSRAVTTVWGGLDVGSAVGLLLSGPLIRMYGWPSVFYLFAVLGGIWCLLWPLVRPGMQVRLQEMQIP